MPINCTLKKLLKRQSMFVIFDHNENNRKTKQKVPSESSGVECVIQAQGFGSDSRHTCCVSGTIPVTLLLGSFMSQSVQTLLHNTPPVIATTRGLENRILKYKGCCGMMKQRSDKTLPICSPARCFPFTHSSPPTCS